MKYKHIVFDVDGTLLDTEKAVLSSFQDVLYEVRGKRVPVEELRFALGITGEDALKQIEMDNPIVVLRRWEELLRQYADTVSVYDGIAELAAALTEGGCRLGIVTSRTRAEFDHDFGEFDIDRYFGVTVCADDTTQHKPAADPLLKYMELTGAGREEVLYIGDSVYDSKCAENAGVDFALAVWGSHTEKTRADYYLRQPMELLKYQLPEGREH